MKCMKGFFDNFSYCSGKLIIVHTADKQIKSIITYTIYAIRIWCGEKEIRTLGPLQDGCFQDSCNRPLCHLSIFIYKIIVVIYKSIARENYRTAYKKLYIYTSTMSILVLKEYIYVCKER